MTQKEYGDRIGISQPRVAQLIAQGMPMDCPESADIWRSQNVRSRAKSIPKQKTPPDPTAIEQEGPYRPIEAETPLNHRNGRHRLTRRRLRKAAANRACSL